MSPACEQVFALNQLPFGVAMSGCVSSNYNDRQRRHFRSTPLLYILTFSSSNCCNGEVPVWSVNHLRGLELSRNGLELGPDKKERSFCTKVFHAAGDSVVALWLDFR